MSNATETQGNIEKALRQEVESLQNLVGSLTQQLQEQQGTIDQLSQQLKRQQERIAQLPYFSQKVRSLTPEALQNEGLNRALASKHKRQCVDVPRLKIIIN